MANSVPVYILKPLHINDKCISAKSIASVLDNLFSPGEKKSSDSYFIAKQQVISHMENSLCHYHLIFFKLRFKKPNIFVTPTLLTCICYCITHLENKMESIYTLLFLKKLSCRQERQLETTVS